MGIPLPKPSCATPKYADRKGCDVANLEAALRLLLDPPGQLFAGRTPTIEAQNQPLARGFPTGRLQRAQSSSGLVLFQYTLLLRQSSRADRVFNARTRTESSESVILSTEALDSEAINVTPRGSVLCIYVRKAYTAKIRAED